MSFLDSYIQTALWSSNDESNEKGGDPLDKNYSPADLAPETLRHMQADVNQFIELAAAMDAEIEDDALVGHCFWLSRNGHGSGFWDRDEIPEPARTKLDKLAEAFGECNLYVGEDGRIYVA